MKKLIEKRKKELIKNARLFVKFCKRESLEKLSSELELLVEAVDDLDRVDHSQESVVIKPTSCCNELHCKSCDNHSCDGVVY